MSHIPYLLLMIISEILILGLHKIINSKKQNNQLNTVILLILKSLFIWTLSLIMQILLQNTNIPPTLFEGFASFGACFLPIFLLYLGIIFARSKIKIRRYHYLLFIIPIISTILMFTNSFHHLMYKQYSINFSETIWGDYFPIHSIFSYSCIGIGLLLLLFFIIKNAGLFSKQSLLVIIGILVPASINIMGTFNIIPLTVYTTPISFSFGIICCALAIYKFNFLKVAPIALQRIVDRISDSYMVLGDDYIVTDFNKTFLKTFKLKNDSEIRGKNLEQFLKETNLYIDFKKLQDILPQIKDSEKTISYELYVKKINKYFHVEINTIFSNEQSLGTLVLFKDITQHKQDIQTIKDTQESLMESERLSSLGQLIGGIAHNLKTPIMSIAGAAEGLTDLVKEYDESIDDPTVNSQDHHEIASDMSKWIVKIREYTEYMSDVITAVKGQAVAMSNEDDVTFTVGELVKRVSILMKHELKNAIVSLNVVADVAETETVHGDVNNLVQVINNMISNAIQAYNGKPEQNIEFVITKQGNNVIFTIEDHAGGLPQKVQDKLFKEMITTKGKNGTGLGLYMSYSTIKAHFNGNITYETEQGKGTKFNVIIPT